jgi:hypothetical protein
MYNVFSEGTIHKHICLAQSICQEDLIGTSRKPMHKLRKICYSFFIGYKMQLATFVMICGILQNTSEYPLMYWHCTCCEVEASSSWWMSCLYLTSWIFEAGILITCVVSPFSVWISAECCLVYCKGMRGCVEEVACALNSHVSAFCRSYSDLAA